MRTRSIVIVAVVLAAVAFGWTLWRHEAAKTDDRSTLARSIDRPVAAYEPAQSQTTAPAIDTDRPVDAAERARFNEQAREFFAQAPGLSLDEARGRAETLSQELSRIEQAGGMSAGEIFLLRAGLIRAAEPDEQRQAEQIRAIKERYEADSRRRLAQASGQSDPMFELYKVRESEIVAEVMAMQTIPNGLSRDEYLRQRLQAAREQLQGSN